MLPGVSRAVRNSIGFVARLVKRSVRSSRAVGAPTLALLADDAKDDVVTENFEVTDRGSAHHTRTFARSGIGRTVTETASRVRSFPASLLCVVHSREN